jgi:hypothetical protein
MGVCGSRGGALGRRRLGRAPPLPGGEFAGTAGPFDPTVFSAVVLDRRSRAALRRRFPAPCGWEPAAHHMTIAFGRRLADPRQRGARVTLRVVGVGASGTAQAARVAGFPSAGAAPHVTLAVNAAGGGLPAHSNLIREWQEVVPPLELSGRVAEVRRVPRAGEGRPAAAAAASA